MQFDIAKDRCSDVAGMMVQVICFCLLLVYFDYNFIEIVPRSANIVLEKYSILCFTLHLYSMKSNKKESQEKY